jgi:hypothetical protein
MKSKNYSPSWVRATFILENIQYIRIYTVVHAKINAWPLSTASHGRRKVANHDLKANIDRSRRLKMLISLSSLVGETIS